MDLALLVYGINVVSGLNVVFGIATIITLLLLGTCSLVWAVNAGGGYDEYADGVFKVWKILAWFALPITIASCFIPGEKTMYTMVGAYAAEKVAQDPKVQQLSGKVLTIIETKLDDIINEKDKKK